MKKRILTLALTVILVLNFAGVANAAENQAKFNFTGTGFQLILNILSNYYPFQTHHNIHLFLLVFLSFVYHILLIRMKLFLYLKLTLKPLTSFSFPYISLNYYLSFYHIPSALSLSLLIVLQNKTNVNQKIVKI